MDGVRTLYGATKYAAELLAQEFFDMYGVPGIINRCGVIAGPWQMAKSRPRGGGVVVCSPCVWGTLNYIGHDGYQVRDILHVDDLVDLILRQIDILPEISGEVFDVGGGRETSVSLRELTRLCQEVAGNEIEIGVVDWKRRVTSLGIADFRRWSGRRDGRRRGARARSSKIRAAGLTEDPRVLKPLLAQKSVMVEREST